MNGFLSFIMRVLIAVPTAGAAWLVSFFGFDLGLLASTGISFGGGAVSYLTAKEVMKHRFLKSQGLSRREYKYIDKNLEEAREKISRLNKALFSVKQLPSLKQNLEIIRIARKIYSITKKEPRRFYLAEKFYFYHLDSIVELAEKYSFLSSQPTKNRELSLLLKETRKMMDELRHSLERDLDRILSTDLDTLNFEIDVAKRNIKKLDEPHFKDESRRWK